MKKWKLIYELQISFGSPVHSHSYSLRCIPAKRETQKILSCSCVIEPCSGEVSQGRDSFGNLLLTGKIAEPHESFSVKTEADIWTSGKIEAEERAYHMLGMFRYFTDCTFPGPKIMAFSDYIKKKQKEVISPWERACYLMEELWNHFCYKSGSTGIGTTGEEAFAQGCGVCQDYAHILLSLCRREGMTARYVAGAIPGEGATHAWIEVYQDGFWRGFDPTNNKVADETYIVFAVGRDAMDCSLNKGIFMGNAGQRQKVYVKMEEAEGGNNNC